MAFDTLENLERRLLSPSEITLTTDASGEEVRALSGIAHIIDVSTEEKDTGLVAVHLKTDHDNIYDISRAIFCAFASESKVLLEMTLKKANLEEIFLELT